MSQFQDLTGRRFERLVVQWWVGRKYETEHAWLCMCDCGGLTVVGGNSLRQGNTKSCGCLQKERTSQASLRHGHARYKDYGGISPEYRSWQSMLTRCTNLNSQDWKDYGGRGIKVCLQWMNSFPAFLADVGEKPKPKRLYSLDRIDVDGNYEPGNVRWATRKEQMSNQRRSNALRQLTRLEDVSGLSIEQLIKQYC